MAAEGSSARVRPGSVLHRLTGVTPGYAPGWVCSRNSCDGFDLFAVINCCGLISLLALGLFVSDWSCAVTVPVCAAVFLLLEGFSDRERFGRARLYRGECVWCGRTQTLPRSNCPNCRLRT